MQTKEEHYRSMILAVQRYAPNADMDLIERAYRYADGKHKDQLRKSGEPYIIHPLAVAEIVAEIGLDSDAIAAALLHDCLEDTDASFEEISRLFGETIAELVEGVTKLTRVQYSTMEEQQMENLRKMFMAMDVEIASEFTAMAPAPPEPPERAASLMAATRLSFAFVVSLEMSPICA